MLPCELPIFERFDHGDVMPAALVMGATDGSAVQNGGQLTVGIPALRGS